MATSAEMITKVFTMLDSIQGEPSVARMILKALPYMFTGTRHKYQLQLIDMARDTLRQAHAAQTEQQTTMTTEFEEGKAKSETLKQECHEAEMHEKEACEANELKAAELSEKKSAVKDNEACHAETKIAKDNAERKYRQLEKEKCEVDSVVNGSMQMLLQGSWQDDEARDDFVSAVCEFMQKMECDKVLLAALPKALGCCPDERGAFSKAALDETVRLLNEKSSSIASAHGAGVESFEERAAEDLGAWAIADVSRDKERQVAQEKKVAEDFLHAAIVNSTISQQKANDAEVEVNHILSKRSLTEARIEDLEMALVELVRLEGEAQEANTENEDSNMPAAKRMKIGHDETKLCSESPLVADMILN